MTVVGNIWGVVTTIALLWGCIQPALERADNLRRFKESK